MKYSREQFRQKMVSDMRNTRHALAPECIFISQDSDNTDVYQLSFFLVPLQSRVSLLLTWKNGKIAVEGSIHQFMGHA